MAAPCSSGLALGGPAPGRRGRSDDGGRSTIGGPAPQPREGEGARGARAEGIARAMPSRPTLPAMRGSVGTAQGPQWGSMPGPVAVVLKETRSLVMCVCVEDGPRQMAVRRRSKGKR